MPVKKSGLEKNLAAISVVVIIAVLMIYYFMIYVPENERVLRSAGLRTMRTLALNCAEKYAHYPNALASAPAEYTAKWLKANFPTLVFACRNGDILSANAVETKPDTMSRENEFTNYGDPLLQPDREASRNNKTETSGAPKIRGQKFLFQTGVEVDMGQASEKDQGLFLKLTNSTSNYIPFVVSIPAFMANLKHYDFFEDIFLLGPSYDKEGKINNEAFQVLDESRLGLVQYSVPGSLLPKGMSIYLDTLSGERYYVFHQLVKLDSGLELSLVGLISKKSFDQRARQVPNWLLIFIVLGLLLLVQVWPILKLFLISKEERLRSIDVQLTTFSIVFSVAFVTILLGAWFTYYGPQKSAIKKTLLQISNSMSVQFNNEIAERKMTIEEVMPDSIFIAGIDRKNLSYSYNELFIAEVDHNYGNVQTLFIEKERDYPILSCGNSSGTNVRTRRYFTVPADALRNGVRIGPYTQSLISRSSGSLECAVSVQSGSSRNVVKVLTSFLPSIMNPTLPSGYTFAIIDKSGEVQFHSDRTKIKNENLFEECDNSNTLRSYVGYGAADYLDLRYGDKDYESYCRPLFNDWYLVMFCDLETSRTFSASVVVLCLGSLIILILYIVFLHILFKLDKSNFTVLQFRPFFFKWLNPLTISREKFFFLSIGLTVMACFHLWWIFIGRSVIGTFIWCCLTTSLCYAFVYGVLRPRTSTLTHFELVLGLLISLLSFLFFRNAQAQGMPWQHTVLIFSLIMTFLVGYLTGIRLKETAPSTMSGQYIRYRIFLMLCLLNLAVLPAVMFFQDHLLHENIVRTRAGLRTEIAKRQIRTLQDQSDVKQLKWPANYTDSIPKTILDRDIACVPEGVLPYFGVHDNAFYNQIGKYFGHDQVAHQGLLLNDPTQLDSIQFWHVGDTLVVARAPHTLLAAGPVSWKVYTKKLYSLYKGSEAKVVIWLIVFSAVLTGLLWKALFKIPNKIFYLPLRYSTKPKEHIDAYPPGETDKKMKEWLWDVEGRRFKKSVNEAKELKFDICSSREKAFYENAIVNLQNRDESVFRKVWENCTPDEKFFLYDLAEDGIVNQGDRKVLKQLVDKELVYVTPSLEIVSPPLTNFILGAMSPEELYAMEQSARKEGRWNNWRFPLIILVFATLGFLSLIQEDFMTRMGAVIASIAVILPHLVGLGANLSKLLPQRKQ